MAHLRAWAAMILPASVDDLRRVAVAAGLDRLGVADAAPFTDSLAVLEQRKAQGLHGGMQFTYRNPARSTDAHRALPAVRSLVVGARSYPSDQPEPSVSARARGPLAKVARYATADHYAELRHGLDAVADRLRTDGWVARVVLDDNAMVDRAAAERAGLGWFGKNTNLLLEGAGSFFVLGSVLTDAPLPPDDRVVEDGCGSCTRCLDGCPTGALVAPGVLDARRCLAWLVQAEGVFPAEFRIALGDRLYGCDECQEVCPPTVRGGRRRALDPAAAEDTYIPVLDVLAASDDELLARYGRWYIPRREPRYLRRNALVVLANAATVPIEARVEAALARALAADDAIVRAHAVWAARRLGATDLLVTADIDADADPLVRAELAAEVVARPGSGPTAATASLTIRLRGAR